MIVINRETNKAYENLTRTEAAAIIGVSRMTIIRWQRRLRAAGQFKEVYNRFDIFFDTERSPRNRKYRVKKI